MLSRFYLNIRVLLKHVMSFFDTLSDGDRAEIGYGIGGDPTAFGVLMHQHREAQALQRQIAQHGTGYQAASMAGTLPQATEPSTASPAQRRILALGPGLINLLQDQQFAQTYPHLAARLQRRAGPNGMSRQQEIAARVAELTTPQVPADQAQVQEAAELV